MMAAALRRTAAHVISRPMACREAACHRRQNNQRRIAAKPFTAVKVNLMLNIVKTALYLGVCVYWPC
jgi:hypothetical protein